jgi:XTP/dITP diphosphohydrolase
MLTLVLATTNEGKLRELCALLADLPVEVIGMGEVVSDSFSVSEIGQTFEENAVLKARAVCQESPLRRSRTAPA